MMRLDPLIDRGEYNTLLHFEELFSQRPLDQLLPTLRESDVGDLGNGSTSGNRHHRKQAFRHRA